MLTPLCWLYRTQWAAESVIQFHIYAEIYERKKKLRIENIGLDKGLYDC